MANTLFRSGAVRARCVLTRSQVGLVDSGSLGVGIKEWTLRLVDRSIDQTAIGSNISNLRCIADIASSPVKRTVPVYVMDAEARVFLPEWGLDALN